jgi:5-methylcytosine-specific restriction endonuclease McrA
VTDRICSVDECSQPHYGRGFCVKHYKADHYRRNKSQHRARGAAWRAANSDRDRELNRLRYDRNREEVKARSAAYRKAHPEEARAVVREWVRANPERKAAIDAAYRAANPDRVRARSAAYYRANPERWNAAYARRKARKMGRVVRPADYAQILIEHGMVCHICGGDIADRSDLHFDHVIPLARGGEHSVENIRPSHARCNLQKGPRLIAG